MTKKQSQDLIQIDSIDVSRRSFLKSIPMIAAASTISPAALFSLSSYANDNSISYINHATHYGPFVAVVKNGKIIDALTIKQIDAKPTVMLTKGIVDRTYDSTRVKYPMVRKSYLNNIGKTDKRTYLRGKEPFVRVTWDVAINLVADQIIQTIKEHGNEAIFNSSYGGWSHAGVLRPNVLIGRFFNLIGGCSYTVGDYSGGASQVSLPFIIGDMEVYSQQTSWQQIKKNTEIFVLVGVDPYKNNRIEYRVADHQMYPNWDKFKENGIKFISINPQKTTTDKQMGSEWIKIIPNTDTALFLAMSYHLLVNDKYDKEFVKKYTVGFKKVASHLKGEDNTEAKTPEWAEKITGIKASEIKRLAILFSENKTEFAGAWSLQRANHGEMTHWAMINFCALLGNIGLPGEGVGFSWHYGNGGMPSSDSIIATGISQGVNQIETFCPASRINDMILNPNKEFTRNGGIHRYPDIKMVYNAGVNFISHQQDTNELLRGLQRCHTIINQDPWWNASSRFADIILPASSTLERDDITSGGTYSNDKVYAMKKVIEPIGESLSDYEIFTKLATKLNIGHQFTEGKSITDIVKASYAKTTAAKTVTFEKFWQDGFVKLPFPKGAENWVRHSNFRKDPNKNHLHTQSGKIEMFCQQIADFKLDDCPPLPMFLEPFEYLGNADKDQLHVVSPHPYNRLHSQMANTSIREIDNIKDREFLLINSKDAKKRNIKNGDLVELYNKRGSLIAGAKLSDDIMPGVVSIYEGAWLSVDNKGRCNSGAVNIITSSKASSGLSQATSANTCLAYLRLSTDIKDKNLAYTPPEISSNLEFKYKMKNNPAILKNNFNKKLSPGAKLFYQKCTLCHIPRNPKSYTKKQWNGILPSMLPRTGTTKKEQKLIREFLYKNAKPE